MKSCLENILQILMPFELGKGDVVYWKNPVDEDFSGVYEVRARVDKHNRVHIYNKKKGDRHVYLFELTLLEKFKNSKSKKGRFLCLKKN